MANRSGIVPISLGKSDLVATDRHASAAPTLDSAAKTWEYSRSADHNETK
jgi:hypothetical protein